MMPLGTHQAGRRRLYSLSDGNVCDLVDGLTALADKYEPAADVRTTLPRAGGQSRLCLGHLGGELGCLVTNAMFARGLLRHIPSGLDVTVDGQNWLARLGIDTQAHTNSLRSPLRLCHDWTQGGHHLGGGIAGALLTAFRKRDWMRVKRGEIAVILTPIGVSALRSELGLDPRHHEALNETHIRSGCDGAHESGCAGKT